MCKQCGRQHHMFNGNQLHLNMYHVGYSDYMWCLPPQEFSKMRPMDHAYDQGWNDAEKEDLNYRREVFGS